MVAHSGVRVLGRDEVYGAYKGVSESVPPGGGGALVATAPLRTLPRAFVFLPSNIWWGKASSEFRVLTIYTAPNPFSFVHTALSRRVVVGFAWASVRAARDNDAFCNLGRWDRFNRVNIGRCRTCCAPMEGYNTRVRPFTHSEGRLRAPGQEQTIGARATGGFELDGRSWVSQPRTGSFTTFKAAEAKN